VLLLGTVPLGAVAQSLENAIKATFLYKFALYVEWPGGAFTTAASALSLCVIGEDPFSATLDTALNGQRVDGRDVVVRRVKTVEPDCHIVFAGGDDAELKQTLATARGRSVLTVTDNRNGASAGIINFVVKDNRVRFTIDDAAAAQNGLNISSKLLSLALDVKLRPRATMWEPANAVVEGIAYSQPFIIAHSADVRAVAYR
jgi:hypothetical protein